MNKQLKRTYPEKYYIDTENAHILYTDGEIDTVIPFESPDINPFEDYAEQCINYENAVAHLIKVEGYEHTYDLSDFRQNTPTSKRSESEG